MTTTAPSPRGTSFAGIGDRLRGLRNWFADRPTLVDWMLALLVTALSVVGQYSAEADVGERVTDNFAYVLVIIGNLPIAWRRSAPLVALGLVAPATFVYWILDYTTFFGGLGLLIALYSALACGASHRRSLIAVGVTIATGASVIMIGIAHEGEDVGFGDLVALVTLFGIAAAMGDNVRHRRAYLAELEEKAARAEDDARIEAERAVSAERTRIARELHDVVAHSVSVMVVHASAGQRMIATDPDRAAETLATIEATGRDSLVEMRRILGVLRSDHETTELVPQPTIDDFAELISSCRDAGLDVELEVVGTPERHSSGLELAAFRIVQEALTNVLKHAGRATATVTLTHRRDGLAVTIADNGRGASAAIDGHSAGNGLVGMRERVELFNGTLDAGPQAGGGFRVHAELPAAGTARPQVAVAPLTAQR